MEVYSQETRVALSREALLGDAERELVGAWWELRGEDAVRVRREKRFRT